MSRNINQIYMDNPSTTSADDDLFYKGNSPYSPADDSAIKWKDIIANIGSLNLNFLADNQTSFANLGLGSGDELIIDEGDFVAGLYTLTNPCPNIIFVNAETAGNAIKLPAVNQATSFIPSQGPIFLIQSGYEPVEIQDSSGSPIVVIEAPACEQFVLTSNALPQGVWFVRSFVSTVNGQSGDVVIDGAVIDLQEAYDNGDDATINLSNSRPLIIDSGSLSSNVNSITTPSTGVNTVANYRVLGWSFIPTADITITALQYDDTLFTVGGTRETGIYVKSTQELLTSVFIAKTDPLDSTTTFRTKTLPDPLQVQSGVEYVFATVVPGGESNHTNANAVPSSVTIPGRWGGPSSLFPLPLSFPTTETVVANVVQVGSFEYSVFTEIDSVKVNDSVTNSKTIFEVNSTSRASRPFPSMTNAQFSAISSKEVGSHAFTTDDKLTKYFDGTAEQTYLTVDNVLAGTNMTVVQNGDGTITLDSAGSTPGLLSNYSGWAFAANTTVTPFNFTNFETAIAINPAVFDDILSSEFVNEVTAVSGNNTPVFRYTGTATQFFECNFNMYVKGTVVANKEYVFQIVIIRASGGGSIEETGYSGNVLLQDSTTIQAIALSGVVQLLTGDRIFVAVKNLTDTTSCLVGYGNADILNIDGTDSAVPSVQGTANQVLVNGTSGSPVSGANAVLTTPQNIGTSSTPTFQAMTLSGSGSALNLTNNTSTSGQSLGPINWLGHDSAAASVFYGRILPAIVSNTAGATTSKMPFSVQEASVLTEYFNIDGSTGTINFLKQTSFVSPLLPYTDVSGTSQAMAVNHEYTASNASLVTLTLPSTAAVGSVIIVNGKGGGLFKIAQNAGQIIHLGSTFTTTGVTGSLSSTLQFDSITLKCITADTVFMVQSSVGNFDLV